MAAKKKRMTQKEKDLNRAWKKEMQEKGILPPDKKRLNRRKFIEEVRDEWNAKDQDCYIWDFYLMRAVSYMMSQTDKRLNPSPEAVGVAKLLKAAMKLKEFQDKIKSEGREDKKRLNRRKFIEEVRDEWNAKDQDCYIWDFYLMRAVSYMMSQTDKRLNPSPEAVGVAKLLKAAMKLKEFQDKIKSEGREDYTITEEYEYIKEVLKM